MISFLLDTLLATGALIALVLVLRKPVARAFGAQYAYALWLLPLLRFAMPPIWLPASFAAAPETSIAAAAVPAAATTTTIIMPAAMPGASAAVVAESAGPSLPWMELILALWLGGALAFIVWRWIGYRRMRRDLLAEARPVGEVGRIRLVETPAVSAPVAFGVTDKVVALPMFFMAIEDREARDLAIAHELAHHRGPRPTDPRAALVQPARMARLAGDAAGSGGGLRRAGDSGAGPGGACALCPGDRQLRSRPAARACRTDGLPDAGRKEHHPSPA